MNDRHVFSNDKNTFNLYCVGSTLTSMESILNPYLLRSVLKSKWAQGEK